MREVAFEPFVPRPCTPARATPSLSDFIEAAASDAQSVSAPEPALERPTAHDLQAARDQPAEPNSTRSEEPVVERSTAPDATPVARASVREEATRIASLACARMFGDALFANPKLIAQLVDEAIALVGGAEISRVRLHPADAASLELGSLPLERDASLSRGAVCVETTSGAVETNVAVRAELFSRRAADT